MKNVLLLDLLPNPTSLILSFDETRQVFIQGSYILLVLFLLFLQGKTGDLVFLNFHACLYVVHNVVVSYVVYQSREGNFCNSYSPFTLQIYFFTQEIFKVGQSVIFKNVP